MKILFIYYDWPNYHGGPIVNARRLLPELHTRGHEIYCLVFYKGGHSPSSAYLENQGIQCYRQRLNRYTEKQITWILRQISAINPDVFVPNLSVAGYFAARWAKESGIATKACHRSDDPFHWAMVDEFVTGKPKWAVSGLVCVSDDLRQKVEERKPDHTKLCVIPSGVPVIKKGSLQTGPLKLVYVGRLVQKQKRVYDLVDALARIMHTNNDITASLIGDGNERKNLQAHIDRLGMKERFRIIGTVPNEKIQAELVKYHVLVLLSDYEGTPGAVMDAMAAGLVPVCLDIPGGVQELIEHEHTGLLVPDRGQGFRDAIQRLTTDRALRLQIATNARERVARNYSLKVAADRWEEFCGKLLKKMKHRSPIVIPRKITLPPLRPGLDREDRRMRPLSERAIKALVRPIKQKLLRSTSG